MSRMEDYNYHMDSRTWPQNRAFEVEKEGRRGLVIVKFCESVQESIIEAGIHPEGWDGTATYSFRNKICGQCKGEGTMVNPSIDAGGLNPDDFADDPDFKDAYFGGAYDIQCTRCKGRGRIRVPEFPDKIQKIVEDWEQEEAEYQYMCAQERAMGA